MSHTSRVTVLLTLILLLASVPGFAQWRSGGAATHSYGSYHSAPAYRGYGGDYGGYPSFGNYGYQQGTAPNYWWAGPYPSEDPCQAGCNPNAGYEWDSVGALILDTNPANARVTLDGIYAGTTDRLGPFQLPVGQHTFHIEAAGFEASDIVVKFDKPGVQTLNVELKRLTASAKPAPRH
jgi:hypothetical protein